MESNKLPLNEWPAEDYAIGSYIQATVSDMYLSKIQIDSHDDVLDIGCGEGTYSLKIIEKFTMASFLGIDRSENMLGLARQKIAAPNIRFEYADVIDLPYQSAFDRVISFWCLQWVHDLVTAFENIYQALRKKGKLFIILPYGDDALINTYLQVKASRKFPILEHFCPPVDYPNLRKQMAQLYDLPFDHLNIDCTSHSMTLPSLQVFERFLQGVPFFQGQVPDNEIAEIYRAMVAAYDKTCHEQYHGVYQFNFHTYFITAQK